MMSEEHLYERAIIEAHGIPNFEEMTTAAQREAIVWLFQQYMFLVADMRQAIRRAIGS